MIDVYIKLLKLLTKHERYRSFQVFFLMLLVAFFESLGVASILPFMTAISNPDNVLSNKNLRLVYDYFGFANVNNFIVFLGVGFVSLMVVSLAFRALSQWAQLKFTKMRVHYIGTRLIVAYLKKPYSWYLDKHTSKLTTKILSEVNQVISKSLFPSLQLLSHALVSFGLVIFLLILHPLLAGTSALFIIVCYFIIYKVVRKPLHKFGKNRYETNLQRFKVTQETFGGIKEIKVLGLEENMINLFKEPSYQTANEEVRIGLVSLIPGLVMQAIMYLGIVVILIYMTAAHNNLLAALPILAAFTFACYRLMPAIQQIYRHATSIKSAAEPLEQLYSDLVSVEIQNNIDVTPAKRMEPLNKSIVLSELSFSYPGSDKPALTNINIHIPAFSRIGFVGPTGSGKTTCVDVILGLLTADSGALRVDDLTINQSNVRSWQQCIGYIPQHIFLADDTIAANIAFGVPAADISIDNVVAAAKASDLHDFILQELPSGYQTVVGERGVRLSGGQRQRIGIARALYRNPDLIIMDEATSALDNITEQRVMESIEKLSGSKTVIIIAHRLTTVEKCDNIFLLVDGKVSAHGSYEELINKSNYFKELSLSNHAVEVKK